MTLSAEPILGATADSAFAHELHTGGVDRIVAYHSSVYRADGLPSIAGLLPWGSANEQTLSMVPDVMSGAASTPVLATICAQDGVLDRSTMLAACTEAGVTGILNAPTVGLIDGRFRAALEESGLGMTSEIALLAEARRHDLEAWAYVFDRAWVEQALGANASGVIIHLGFTGISSGDEVARVVDCIAPVPDDIPVVLHGGSLRKPSDVLALMNALDPLIRRSFGFLGASAFEAEHTLPLTTLINDWRRALTTSSARTHK